jgi:hypothetical protein
VKSNEKKGQWESGDIKDLCRKLCHFVSVWMSIVMMMQIKPREDAGFGVNI